MERMADTEKDAVKAAKDAEKAAKKAKQERIKQSKPKKEGSVASRAGKSIKKFWKDFTGTIKKVVWPGRTQVLKSSAVVLASIIVVGLVIWGFDQGLTALFGAGKDLAGKLGEQVGVTEEVEAGAEDDTSGAADVTEGGNEADSTEAESTEEASTEENAESETESTTQG
jgi:preprotein translocase subunit SecE